MRFHRVRGEPVVGTDIELPDEEPDNTVFNCVASYTETVWDNGAG